MNEQEVGCLGLVALLIPIVLVMAMIVGLFVGFLVASGVSLDQLVPRL